MADADEREEEDVDDDDEDEEVPLFRLESVGPMGSTEVCRAARCSLRT